MKRIKNAIAVSTIPIAILVGVEGSSPRASSHFQNIISGGVRMMTHAGLIAFEMIPVTLHAVLSLAQYVSVEPFWWKTIQKTITIRYTTIRAAIRFHSGTDSIPPFG